MISLMTTISKTIVYLGALISFLLCASFLPVERKVFGFKLEFRYPTRRVCLAASSSHPSHVINPHPTTRHAVHPRKLWFYVKSASLITGHSREQRICPKDSAADNWKSDFLCKFYYLRGSSDKLASANRTIHICFRSLLTRLRLYQRDSHSRLSGVSRARSVADGKSINQIGSAGEQRRRLASNANNNSIRLDFEFSSAIELKSSEDFGETNVRPAQRVRDLKSSKNISSLRIKNFRQFGNKVCEHITDHRQQSNPRRHRNWFII